MGAMSVAVASGKGGVGKSILAANLAVALGRAGRRVLLVDGDLGLGNLSMLLGLNPEYALEDVLSGRRAPVDALMSGPEDISVLCSSADGDTEYWRRARPTSAVGDELARLEERFEYVIVDTGAGVVPHSLDFIAAAALGLIVTTPEPTATGDAYATLKMLQQRGPRGALGLVVNMADSQEQALDLYDRFAQLVGRFLGAQIDNWGYIPLDRNVRAAVNHQVPFVLTSPPTPAATAVSELSGMLLRDASPRFVSRGGFFAAVWGALGSADGPRPGRHGVHSLGMDDEQKMP